MKLAIIFLLVEGLLMFSFSYLVYADVPQMINYQGKITTPAGALIDTTIQMTFTIYDDSTTGNVLWADTIGSVSVQKGIFSVLLGSGNTIPDSVFDGNVRYLGTKVGNDPEMTPRKSMVSVPYALRTGGDGDWTISGSDMYSAVSGNVGIGTSSPGEKLEVNGNIKLGGNMIKGAYDIQIVADGNLRDIDLRAQDVILFRKGIDIKGVFDVYNGRLGIGTTSPAQILDVVGTAQMTGFKMPTGAGSGKILTSDASGVGTWQTASSGISGSGTTNYLSRFTAATTLGNSAIYQSGSNIGIGTTSPGDVLDVAGYARADRFVDRNNTSFYADPASVSYFNDFRANIFYDRNNTAYYLDPASTSTLYNVNMMGTVGIGTSSPGYKLHVNGSFYSSTVNTGYGDYELYAMNQDVRTSDNPTFNRIHLSDYGTALGGFHVGGTSDPGTDNLVVDGNATIGGSLTVNGVSMGKIYLTSNETILSTDGGTKVLYWDKTNGEIEITNTSGDYCDYWWQSQKGATTSGNSSAVATGTSNYAIISGTNSNDYGFEVHFGQADGTEGWCSVWLQYANGALVGHYIKY